MEIKAQHLSFAASLAISIYLLAYGFPGQKENPLPAQTYTVSSQENPYQQKLPKLTPVISGETGDKLNTLPYTPTEIADTKKTKQVNLAPGVVQFKKSGQVFNIREDGESFEELEPDFDNKAEEEASVEDENKTATSSESENTDEEPGENEPNEVNDTIDSVVKHEEENFVPEEESDGPYDAGKEAFDDELNPEADKVWMKKKQSKLFPMPDSIKNMVFFWTQVFGRYGKDQYVYYHPDDVGVIYSVLDLSTLTTKSTGLSSGELSALKKKKVGQEWARVKQMLLNIQAKKKKLTNDEKRIAKLFKADEAPDLNQTILQKKINVQMGFSHRFHEAIVRSGMYMDEMEKIFAKKGLPIELTRLPLIESAFSIKAVSSANAVGLWQFIPATGKNYLKIDSFADQRKDPILATYAAAEHLKREHKLLGAWPLAVNAYNTGPGRIKQAMKELQTTDIGKIIRNFDGSGYKFYSRNYYPEFLAAVHVFENQKDYFGKIKKLNPLKADLFMPQEPIYFDKVVKNTGLGQSLMASLNPSLSPDVLSGKKPLPAGYLVRVPDEAGSLFAAAASKNYEKLDKNKWHLVEKGETFALLAKQYKVSESDLRKVNSFLPGDTLTAGFVLEIPKKNQSASKFTSKKKS